MKRKHGRGRKSKEESTETWNKADRNEKKPTKTDKNRHKAKKEEEKKNERADELGKEKRWMIDL